MIEVCFNLLCPLVAFIFTRLYDARWRGSRVTLAPKKVVDKWSGLNHIPGNSAYHQSAKETTNNELRLGEKTFKFISPNITGIIKGKRR